jgi:hypothetical protein
MWASCTVILFAFLNLSSVLGSNFANSVGYHSVPQADTIDVLESYFISSQEDLLEEAVFRSESPGSSGANQEMKCDEAGANQEMECDEAGANQEMECDEAGANQEMECGEAGANQEMECDEAGAAAYRLGGHGPNHVPSLEVSENAEVSVSGPNNPHASLGNPRSYVALWPDLPINPDEDEEFIEYIRHFCAISDLLPVGLRIALIEEIVPKLKMHVRGRKNACDGWYKYVLQDMRESLRSRFTSHFESESNYTLLDLQDFRTVEANIVWWFEETPFLSSMQINFLFTTPVPALLSIFHSFEKQTFHRIATFDYGKVALQLYRRLPSSNRGELLLEFWEIEELPFEFFDGLSTGCLPDPNIWLDWGNSVHSSILGRRNALLTARNAKIFALKSFTSYLCHTQLKLMKFLSLVYYNTTLNWSSYLSRPENKQTLPFRLSNEHTSLPISLRSDGRYDNIYILLTLSMLAHDQIDLLGAFLAAFPAYPDNRQLSELFSIFFMKNDEFWRRDYLIAGPVARDILAMLLFTMNGPSPILSAPRRKIAFKLLRTSSQAISTQLSALQPGEITVQLEFWAGNSGFLHLLIFVFLSDPELHAVHFETVIRASKMLLFLPSSVFFQDRLWELFAHLAKQKPELVPSFLKSCSKSPQLFCLRKALADDAVFNVLEGLLQSKAISFTAMFTWRDLATIPMGLLPRVFALLALPPIELAQQTDVRSLGWEFNMTMSVSTLDQYVEAIDGTWFIRVLLTLHTYSLRRRPSSGYGLGWLCWFELWYSMNPLHFLMFAPSDVKELFPYPCEADV